MCKLNTYNLRQVDYHDRNRDAEEIQNLPTHLQVGGMNNSVTEWLEDDSSILDSWKALRSEQRMFLYAVIDAIDILVAHLGSLNLKEVQSKRNQSFIVGGKEPDFLYTNVHDLQIIHPKRFLYSKSTMELDANIKAEEQIHAKFEALHRRALQDEGSSAKCKKCFEDGLNIYKQCKQKSELCKHKLS